MYTSQKLAEFISDLDNLSQLELMAFKNIIDSLILKKSAETSSFISLMNTEQIDTGRESGLIEYVNFISNPYISNASDIPQGIPNQPWVPKFGAASVRGSVRSRKIADVSEIKVEIEKPIFTPKSRRPSGFWKGKVSMPDNFNDLSSDIVSDFGMD